MCDPIRTVRGQNSAVSSFTTSRLHHAISVNGLTADPAKQAAGRQHPYDTSKHLAGFDIGAHNDPHPAGDSSHHRYCVGAVRSVVPTGKAFG